jgi:hypothetical protein
MIINEDFKFRDDLVKEDKETVPVELLTGDYKGVILRYTTVSIKENANDTATMNFAYELLEMGDHTETALRKDVVFNQYIGLVLNAMILEAIDGEPNESRKDDIEEPVEE